MAEVIYELATDISLENIKVHRRYYDGELSAYRLTANEGYKMYDTEEKMYEPDENGNDVPMTYYCKEATIPAIYPVESWTYVAISENEAGKKPTVIEEATEQDYQNALAEMGVVFND